MTPSPTLLPDDVHNRTLVERAHPDAWKNPEPAGRYTLVAIGGGTAGLVSAVGAAGLGAKVAIVERHLMGGDCLNYGCVPSKALIRTARAVADVRKAHQLGVRVGSAEVDFEAAMTRLRRLRAELVTKDSVARLSSLGIDVFLGHARFVAPDAIAVGESRLQFARAVIATGSRFMAPQIPGLAASGYLTHETIFSLTALPARLAIIGAGSIGCELAQAFSRLGSRVTLIDRDLRLLPREDPDVSALLRATFEREGIRVVLDAQVARVDRESGSGVRLVIRGGTQDEVLRTDALLVTGGRSPNVDGLDLQRAGIRSDERGLVVNDRLRTSNPRVWAAGDVASSFKFTHAADATARLALRNALFFGRKRMSSLVIPRATYTDPEVAHIGISADDAARRNGVRTFTEPLTSVDRAVIDGVPDGFARIHADRRGRILGATVVASHAGDLIAEIGLAMGVGASMGALARTVHPYPTQSEVWKALADAWNRARVTPRVRALGARFFRWRW
jgi:pyruvate/2-oxoglutarate dehydrogenase complex dihydrolipoamide dehydrogenase (E3) component